MANIHLESARKVLEETQYVAKTQRSGFTKSVVGFGVDWKLVGFQCTNCSQGLVAESLSVKLCPIKLNNDMLECVDKLCYLGDMISSGGGAEDK